MKGQYLFHSFLPGVTAAVLTTQPALAGTVSEVHLASSPDVLTATDSRTLFADHINTQLPHSTRQIFPDIVPKPGLTPLNLRLSSSKSNLVVLTRTTGIFGEQISKKDEGKFSHLRAKLKSAKRSEDEDFKISQQQSHIDTSEQQIVASTAVATPDVDQKASFSLSALRQPVVSSTNSVTPLSKVLPTAVRGTGAANLLAANNCPQAQKHNSTLVSASLLASSCRPQNLNRNRVVQGYNFTPDSISSPEETIWEATPTPQQSEEFSDPADTGQLPQQPETQPETREFAPAGAVPIPENLIPDANPLQFPTKPEEVTLEENQPITLAQALEIAKRNNRDLQVSLLELERSQAALREAQAALLPNVGLSADVTRSRSAGSDLQLRQQEQQTGIPSPSAESSTGFSGQAQLTYDIFTSGRRQANIRQAEERVKFDELAVERQSEEIRLNVTTEYYDLQQADEQVRIAQSSVENAQASLRDAQALEAAGVGTRFDVLRSQVNLANSTQELTNGLSQQQIFRRRLALRLSLPQSANISAADPVQLAGLWNQDLESSIVLAFQNRPELQQQLAQRNISEQQRREALSSLGPQVSLIASYNLLDQFDDGVGISDGYSVGVRASLNLYDGGAARSRASQAKANVAIAETQFSEQRNQIRFQVEQAFSTQQANLENVQTANAALEQAREALRLARLRFQAGVGTQTDVINSENDLTRAEGNRITAILDYNRALAQLQRAVTSRAFTE
ncbi:MULTISPECIES: TolC family protein [unclassified Anabaena]|uniref:TolC family protein n=1 Tax=unclassified Anabaena TaxID=2619674 RepID=UPI0039C60611